MFQQILVILLVCNLNAQAIRKNAPTPRIVGGDSANISDYPYQVSILYNGIHGCGGSIITDKFILTAAHCTYALTEVLSIRAGSSFHASGGQVISVSKIHQHPKFNIDTYVYDVAVLQLSKSLTFTKNIAKIQMTASTDTVTNGVLAIATGWGRLSDGGKVPDQLQVVSLPVITTKKCQLYYGSRISTNMFCAGYSNGGKDTCQGDSGGPLVYKGILIGITSWGDVCGQANTPGVFTKLSLLRSYVDSIINTT